MSTDAVMLMVGTMKGAFLFRADANRKRWNVEGPHFPGEPVYAMMYDQRGSNPRMFAATRSFHWGGNIRTSDDDGRTWSTPDRPSVKFPPETDLALVQIWQIKEGHPSEPDVVYCGVEPAALFKSNDRGETWELMQGLHNHEHRAKWQPGGGGLGLHTIILDPENRDRMLVAISTGGAYRTEDNGATWKARNKGVRAVFLPDNYPEFGQCVHKVVNHAQKPERLFLQNHWGLYRSDNWGDEWTDIANGVPSDFGFAMQMHPHDPNTVYIIPLESDQFRCTPEAKMRVYRTNDAGASWDALTEGLPQSGAYETVLRDCLTADSLDSAGVYFGTRSGKLYGSGDSGDSWMEIADGLPPIVCVKAATLS